MNENLVYKCTDCDEVFWILEIATRCYEDDFGVSYLFGNKTYYDVEVCPICKDYEYIEEIYISDEDYENL